MIRCSLNSAAGKATRLRDEELRIRGSTPDRTNTESLLKMGQTESRDHPASDSMHLFMVIKRSGRKADLYLYLVARSRMNGAITPLFRMPL
jgi:hypothetical protein